MTTTSIKQTAPVEAGMVTLRCENNQPLVQLAPELVIAPLRKSGAVLLRGFTSTLTEFQGFTGKFCPDFHQVGTRRAVEDAQSDGNTSEVPRRNFNLFAHSEGTYRPFPPPPELCFFNCVQAPDCNGGETLLFDGVRFLKKLPEDLRQRFEQQGVIYQAVWDTQRWQTEFQVANLAELDQLLLNHLQCSYRILGDDIEVRCHVPAIQQSLGGLAAFANGLLAHLPHISHPRWQDRIAYSKDTNRVFFGDGEEICDSLINKLIDIQDEIAVAHSWQVNDLLILDNTRTMHGRRMTAGQADRRIRSRFGPLKPELRA